VAPGTGLLLASSTVTVIVLVADPSATRVVGLPTTVELAADGVLATNVTSAVSTTFTVPLTTALIVEVPVVVEETVPVITPAAFVLPTGCVIVSVAPREELNVTVAPDTGLLLASNTVTVIVLVAAPSATTLAGEEFTVDVVASGTSALNVKVAVCVIDTPAATALITAVPEVIEDTVPLVCPAASVAPAGCAMVSVAPLAELNVTFTPGTGLLLASSTVTVIVLVADPSATRVVGLP